MNRSCLDCGVVIRRGTRCRACQGLQDRGHNRAWQRVAYSDVRYRSFTPGGLCAVCGIRPATTCGHIRMLVHGGTNARANLQGECTTCSYGWRRH